MSEQAARATAMTRLLFVLQPHNNDEVRIVARISTEWPVEQQELLTAMIDRKIAATVEIARRGL